MVVGRSYGAVYNKLQPRHLVLINRLARSTRGHVTVSSSSSSLSPALMIGQILDHQYGLQLPVIRKRDPNVNTFCIFFLGDVVQVGR